MTANWEQTHLPAILSWYELKDIFSTDDFGLFFQQLPTQALHLKGGCDAGSEHSKVHFTRLAAGNFVGKKFQCLLLANQKPEGASKGLKTYHASTSLKRRPGCIPVFEQYVRKRDVKFHRHHRKISFTSINCPAHLRIENLEFCFYHLISHQKRNQWVRVIWALKAYYCSLVVKRWLRLSDAGNEVVNVEFWINVYVGQVLGWCILRHSSQLFQKGWNFQGNTYSK